MKNEINLELLQALIEEFLNNNKEVFDNTEQIVDEENATNDVISNNEPHLEHIISEIPSLEDGYLFNDAFIFRNNLSSADDIFNENIEEEPKKEKIGKSLIAIKNELIETFYEEIRYVHNIKDILFSDLAKKIEETQSEIYRKSRENFDRLKNTDYVYNFVLSNYGNIDTDKVDDFISYLKTQGFYPLNRKDLFDYVSSIEIIEEDIPFKPDELKTTLDEEFKDYVIKFASLLEKQRAKFNISETNFKTIILKVLKINDTDFKDLNYDYKTKKYLLLKELTNEYGDFGPYNIIKYYNIETGKVYYSIYYENDTLIYGMIPSYEKAIELTKEFLEKSSKYVKDDDTKTTSEREDTEIYENDEYFEKISTQNQPIQKTQFSSDELIKNLSYEDEEIISDQDFIKSRIQQIHTKQEQKLHIKGNKIFLLFRIIAWVLIPTVVGIPYSLMIFLSFRTNDAIRGKAKAKSKTFILITKIIGWFLLLFGLIAGIGLIIITILSSLKVPFILPFLQTYGVAISSMTVAASIFFISCFANGIMLITLSHITENAELKNKMEHSRIE